MKIHVFFMLLIFIFSCRGENTHPQVQDDIEFDFFQTPVPENSINLLVLDNGLIRFVNTNYKIDKLCQEISSAIKSNRSIELSTISTTKYKFYLKVYSVVEDCVQTIRNEKSRDNFDVSYAGLNMQQKQKFDESFNVIIVERPPQRKYKSQ